MSATDTGEESRVCFPHSYRPRSRWSRSPKSGGMESGLLEMSVVRKAGGVRTQAATHTLKRWVALRGSGFKAYGCLLLFGLDPNLPQLAIRHHAFPHPSVLGSYLVSTRNATTFLSLVLCPLLSEIGSCHFCPMVVTQVPVFPNLSNTGPYHFDLFVFPLSVVTHASYENLFFLSELHLAGRILKTLISEAL